MPCCIERTLNLTLALYTRLAQLIWQADNAHMSHGFRLVGLVFLIIGICAGFLATFNVSLSKFTYDFAATFGAMMRFVTANFRVCFAFPLLELVKVLLIIYHCDFEVGRPRAELLGPCDPIGQSTA